MSFVHNESTLLNMKKDELIQLVLGDILVLSCYLRICKKSQIIRVVNNFDDLFEKLMKGGC